MIIISQNKLCAVEPQSIRLTPVVLQTPKSNAQMVYEIYVNEEFRMARYKSEARAKSEFDYLLKKWASGELHWYWMPEDDQSEKQFS